MTDTKELTVFITGCSSGIGRALTQEFAKQGHKVYATARKVETLEELRPVCADLLPLDVTSQESIDKAKEIVGHADVVVNNAGFGLMGPAVELRIDDVRRQFETNVVGPLAVTQAFISGMIEKRKGWIVNVGSVSGVLASPFAGAYCASKAALHTFSDAMRMELSPFGIHVITVQPGGIVSKFGDNATKILTDSFKPDSAYRSLVSFIEGRAKEGQVDAMDAEEFAAKVIPQVLSVSPPDIIRLGAKSSKMPFLRWLLPNSILDKALKKMFGLNGLK